MLMSMGAAVASEGEAPQFAVTHMEIEFPRQALQLSDNHRKSFVPMPLLVDFFLNADDLELRSVKNCRLIDAEERDLQARFLYSGDRFFRVKAGKEVYPHGEWVEVQGIAEVQPKSGKTEVCEVDLQASGEGVWKSGNRCIDARRVQIGGAEMWMLTPGRETGEIRSVEYETADGDWEDYDLSDARSIITENPDETAVGDTGADSGGIDAEKPMSRYIPYVNLAELRSLSVTYWVPDESREVPFRYRLALNGAQSLPYNPALQGAPVPKSETQYLRINKEEHPIMISVTGLEIGYHDAVYHVGVVADLYSDTQRIAQAAVTELHVQDASGRDLAAEVDLQDVALERARASIRFGSPSTDSVTVSGVYELHLGVASELFESTVVENSVGTRVNMCGYSATVGTAPLESWMKRTLENQPLKHEPYQVTITFDSLPPGAQSEDVMLTTEDGQAPCRYAASYHPGKNGITNMKIYAVFDGKPQRFKLSFKTQKASGVRRIPFSYKVSVGGARQQHP